MLGSQTLGLTGFGEALERVLADGLEHPETLVGVTNEALLHQRLEDVENRAGTFSAASIVQPPRKTASREKSSRSGSSRRSWRPVDRRTERLLAGLGAPAAAQEIEARGEPLDDLGRGEHADPCGRQLEGQGKVVETTAEKLDGLVGLDPPAPAEELDGVRVGERVDGVCDLPIDPQELPARDEHAKVGERLEQGLQLRRRVDDLLEVVDQQQQLAGGHEPDEVVLRAERLRDRAHDERRVAKRCQSDPEDPVPEVGKQAGGRLDREPGLPRPARAAEGDQPGAVLEERRDLRHLPLDGQRSSRPGAGRFVFERVRSGGNRSVPSW